MDKKAEVMLSLRISKKQFEVILTKMHENKIYNVRNDLKGKNKRPDSINAVIRDCIDSGLMKKKK